MKNNIRISFIFILVLVLGAFHAISQNVEKQLYPKLFTDRDYCISGDTVWFKVWLPTSAENYGNILRVQLISKNNNLISGVAAQSFNGWAEGFIAVPDSLSTGQYFATAFLNSQRNIEGLELEAKSLLVYNRFAENITEMEIFQPNEVYQKSGNQVFNVNTHKEKYLPGEKVEVNIELKQEIEFKWLAVKATLIDPFAAEIKGKYKFKVESLNPNIPDFPENDGLLLSGKVTDISGNLQSNAVVTLSAGEVQPYFDYYVLGENGDFHFFLKNAFGKADMVLQVVSKNNKEYFIQLENNFLLQKNLIDGQIIILKQEQVEFINTAIKANFAHRLFNPSLTVQPEIFEMSSRFSMPFYGQPTIHVIPDEFIDLPDFREIAREILPGFQYRVKNDEITFRMLNSNQKLYFEEEPLRLINGIPVFNNDLFTNLKSTDISYIDLVQSERIFGDLILKGVLEVSLTDKSNSWMAEQPNIFQFNVSFLQPGRKPGYFFQQNLNKNQPDMRQVYYWELLDVDSLENIEFNLSDRKGKIEISVEGFTRNNEFFQSSKTIKVK